MPVLMMGPLEEGGHCARTYRKPGRCHPFDEELIVATIFTLTTLSRKAANTRSVGKEFIVANHSMCAHASDLYYETNRIKPLLQLIFTVRELFLMTP